MVKGIGSNLLIYWWVFCSLGSVSSLIFQSVMALCSLSPWSVQLLCSQGMPTGVGGWVNGLIWGSKIEEKALVISWGWIREERKIITGSEVQGWG